MIKKLFVVLCMFALVANAQTKKPKTKVKKATDSTAVSTEPEEILDPFEALEATLLPEMLIDANGKKVYYKDRKRTNDSLRAALRASIRAEKTTFWVRTKYPAKGKTGPIQLCMNIVCKDTNLVYCTNDSIVKEPETKKILFEKRVADSVYMLIFVEAFTKSKSDNGLCGAGKESKLYFARWNVKTNIAKWKIKNVQSCIKGITLMSKDPIANWDKAAPLSVRYHRADFFYEILFDHEHPELGIQSIKDNGDK
jgi:hypothetical protein